MSLTLQQFLKYSKNILRSSVNNSNKTFTFVTGNSSADLDSVISAISFAYFESCRDQNSNIFPLINIPIDDLNLRRDILFVLQNAAIDKNDLISTDDLLEISGNINHSIDFILVDHNVPQGDIVKNVISKYDSKIVSIIDHHNDEGKFLDANPRIIEVCGSCSSLVFTYFKETIKNIKNLINLETLKLFCSPILADTSNLKFRTEQKDIEIINFIRSEVYPIKEDDLSAFGRKIKQAKESIDGLCFRDLLRKDYKEYHFGDYKVGISSIVKPLAYLSDTFGKEKIKSVLSDWKKERGLDITIIMTSYVDSKNYSFNRQLAFFEKDKVVEEGVSSFQKELNLQPLDDILGVSVYQQLNVAASRKQVAPILEHYLNSK